jgi:hypothetical protein
MSRIYFRGWSLAVALCVAACATDGGVPTQGRIPAPPKASNDFGLDPQVATIVVRARFVEEHERLFGVDLIEEFGVIPIAVKIGLKGEGSENETVYASPADMNFRLYLEDGTALKFVPATMITEDEELSRKISTRAMQDDDLANFNDAKHAFVFFQLTPRKDFAVVGQKVAHRAGSIERSLSLDRSLLAFSTKRAGNPVPFYLGVSLVPRLTD